jgi:hypothetical protein
MAHKKLFLGTAILLFSMAASAFVDSAGTLYTMTKNRNGIVLKSNKAILYLGKNCDAYSPQYGKGTWGWANGGVLVGLEKKTIGFPRQDSPFDDNRCPI